MKLKRHSLMILQFISVLLIANLTMGQQSDCKVLMPAISGKYSGECKKGLANGMEQLRELIITKDISPKTARRAGNLYLAKWLIFSGEWVKGLKNGIGKMVYRTLAGDS